MSTMSATWRYPLPMRLIHWVSALLVLIAYLTSESAEDGGGGWHALSGLLLLALFIPRVLAYGLKRRPPTGQPAPSPAERVAAASVHLALLLFVVVQPLLGLLAMWGEGESVRLPGGLVLAPMLVVGEGLAHTLEELHEVVGNAFYAVIAVHVLAALWHAWVRRDGVMRRML